jgi:hypothetical protein
MADTALRSPTSPTLYRPEPLIGAMTPVWGYFTGFALAGVAWWWMARWMRPHHREGLMEPALEAPVNVLAAATGGPVAEALVGAETPALPVGGEAAPIAPAVLEAPPIPDAGLAADPAQAQPRKRRKTQPTPH